MAPLSPDNTIRYKVDYTVNGEQHDFQIRSAGSPSAIDSLVDAFLNAVSASFYQIAVTGFSYAVAGSNIFLPVSGSILGNTYGSGAGVYEQKAWYADFIGRSTGGRRWRLALYGTRTLGADFKFATGENADITAGIAVLNSASPLVHAIDGLPVNVYTYANAGVNSHWQRALRP